MNSTCDAVNLTGELKPYPAMKDSGVEWLGEVPTHWELPRLGALLQERGEVNSNRHAGKVLSVLRDRGVIPYSEKGNIGNKMSEDIARYKVVRHNDIVVNCMNVIIGSVGLSRYTGCLSPVYYVLTRRSEDDDPQYLNAYFQTKPFQESLVRIGNGILAHRMRIPMELLKCELFPRPPTGEQTAIVRFLDHADRRIRRYIRAKQKLIALLEEQKQAIIYQAVTGQIDVGTGQPYPSYKDSGVEWLGKVPEHWEVVPLRRATLDSCDGPFGSGLKSSHYSEQGIRVVRLQNIGHGEFKDSDAAFISPEYYSSLGDHSVISEDVLIAGLGDNNHPAGRACVAPGNIIPAMVKADCFRFRLNQARIQPRFAALQLTATATVASALLSTGATRQRINLQATSGRAIGIPSVPEQNLIVKYITAEVSGAEDAQGGVQREIDLLHEYRTRLIADVVTGKLDVRETAASLPEIYGSEAEETLEDTFDTDTELELAELDHKIEEANS